MTQETGHLNKQFDRTRSAFIYRIPYKLWKVTFSDVNKKKRPKDGSLSIGDFIVKECDKINGKSKNNNMNVINIFEFLSTNLTDLEKEAFKGVELIV